jgi:hypothetical protein
VPPVRLLALVQYDRLLPPPLGADTIVVTSNTPDQGAALEFTFGTPNPARRRSIAGNSTAVLARRHPAVGDGESSVPEAAVAAPFRRLSEGGEF